MPKINYDDLPYEKEYSTGEHVGKNAFYRPDPDAGELSEIYRGYYAQRPIEEKRRHEGTQKEN